jgi:alkylresorcinol/alkylpyrone synthase
VIEAVGQALDARFALEESLAVLRRYGNMSSPSVLFALGEHLRATAVNGHDAEDLWLTSFGAGFSAHACRLTRAGPGV